MTAALVAVPRRRAASPTALPPAAPARRHRLAPWAAPAAVVGLASVLRFAGLGGMRDNSFYDAAVRSMGGSWHAFITGAIDPSATVAVDKPPVDLWLQVASTKLLGFGTFALHLPEALGGTLAVLALYDLLRTLFGRSPALAGALALAVLPMAVITSRSDTMDSVMAALVITAAALTARAARDRRPRLLPAAGAVLGLAFEVKLFEALIVTPALVAQWWLGSSLPRGRRARALAGGGAAFAVVALAWLIAVPLVSGAQRPWAFGSTNGSAWNATFVYDGLDRIVGVPQPAAPVVPAPRRRASAREPSHEAAVRAHARAAALRAAPAPAGPLRLFRAAAGVGLRTGIALALTLAALLAALLTRADRELDRIGRAGAVALLLWLATGVVLLSAQGALKPRYLEAIDATIAAVLGVAVVLTVRRLARDVDPFAHPRATGALTVAALVATLAAPAAVSVASVAGRAEDAGAPGALSPTRLAALDGYLRERRHGARYAVGALTVGAAASLIARGEPVAVLAANDARPLTTVSHLRREIAGGQVPSVLLGAPCVPLTPDPYTGCSPIARWVRAHGVDVSRAAGQPHPGVLFAFPQRLDRAGDQPGSRLSVGSSRGTPMSAPSRRSHGGLSARHRRRATRGPRHGSGRG